MNDISIGLAACPMTDIPPIRRHAVCVRHSHMLKSCQGEWCSRIRRSSIRRHTRNTRGYGAIRDIQQIDCSGRRRSRFSPTRTETEAGQGPGFEFKSPAVRRSSLAVFLDARVAGRWSRHWLPRRARHCIGSSSSTGSDSRRHAGRWNSRNSTLLLTDAPSDSRFWRYRASPRLGPPAPSSYA